MENFSEKELEKRMEKLDREYGAAYPKWGNLERLDELNCQLAGLVGKNNRALLREYTDRLIAQYNPDTDWFYRRGFFDALRLAYGKERRRPADETQV